MPDVVDWRSDDPRPILDRVAKHLREGRLVALPTEAGYEGVVAALHPDAVAALRNLADPEEPLAIVLSEALEVYDWLPYLRGVGLRLIRAFWPGPLTLVSNAGAAVGLARRLPVEVQRRCFSGAHLPVRLLDREWPWPLRRLLAAPLLAAPLPGFPQQIGQIAKGREQIALILNSGPIPLVKPPTLVKVAGRTATMIRDGAVPWADIDAASPCRILFVCTGNTCRSPLAEGLCRVLLSAKLGCAPAELSKHGYVVQSAGIAAGPGNPATGEAVTVGNSYGADLSVHRSQPLSLDLLSRADLLFTMTWSHLSLLQSLRVPAAPTPQLLCSSGADVDDPIGGSDEIYRSCAARIWQCLNERLPEMLES